MENVYTCRQHSKIQQGCSEFTPAEVHERFHEMEEFSVCQKSKWDHRICNNAQSGLEKVGCYAHELSER